LLKAGYILPDEQIISSDMQIGTLGMDAAVEVFYDLVLNFYPNALSPQYDSYYSAAVENLPKSPSVEDRFTKMNLHTLSSTLIGLEHQAMSHRRDIVDNEYPSEFFEKVAMPEEDFLRRMDGAMARDQKEEMRKTLSTHVRMERTYLKAWRTFMDRTRNVPSLIDKMLKKECTRNDLFTSLRALNACRFEAKELRDKISRKFVNGAVQTCDEQSLVDGAVGLAGCSYKPRHAAEMTEHLLKSLQKRPQHMRTSYRGDRRAKVIDNLTFAQSTELLKALSTPGFASGEMEVCIRDLLSQLAHINFDMIGNELTFQEFENLYDAYTNLKFSDVAELRKLWADMF